MAADMGVDLGTATILIYYAGRGIVLREPSVVAIDKDSDKIMAVGEEAHSMIGRTPGNIVAIRPLRNGVIADYRYTEAMLKYFLSKVCGPRAFFRPRIMVCVPSGVTSVEKKAVLEAAMQAGARKAYVIEEPLAAALGAGLDIGGPSANMVVDIGGGTTDVAVLALGGIVVKESIRVGGDKFDEDIGRYVKRNFNVMIGERTTENAKVTIGTVKPGHRNLSMEVRGRDMLTGLPRTVLLTSHDVYEATKETVAEIITATRRVLERTPPELAADIVDKGIVLTGGGSLMDGIDLVMAEETGLPVQVAEDPVSCVAIGAGLALGYPEVHQDHLEIFPKVMWAPR